MVRKFIREEYRFNASDRGDGDYDPRDSSGDFDEDNAQGDSVWDL
jgi:hypothetical protein